jgi:hypothetical protein
LRGIPGGIIKKHELTRPDKEDDRVRHIEALNSQTGPVFLTYRASAALDKFVAKKISENRTWISPPRTACGTRPGRFRRGRNQIHRDASSPDSVSLHRRRPSSQRGGGAGFQSRQGAGHSGQFLAVIFPHNQMQILPYNRVLKDLNGLDAGAIAGNSRQGFCHRPPNGTGRRRANTNSVFICRANGTR